MSRGRRISRLKLNPPSSEAAYKYLSSWNGKQLFHDPSNFPPLSPESFSFPPKPFSIDIGCGSGEYLCNLAASQPDENFLGIEISRRSIYQAVNQAANFNLENIHFLKADFHLLYPNLIDNSIKDASLLFPDPNYGSKNTKHRIFGTAFLDQLHPALTPGGRIKVLTDQEPFFEDMLQLGSNHPKYKSQAIARHMNATGLPYPTRFQQAWENIKRKFYYFELIKLPVH